MSVLEVRGIVVDVRGDGGQCLYIGGGVFVKRWVYQ